MGELDKALLLVNSLLDAVTKGMKDDLLQDAITMLQGAIRGEGDHRTREKLEVVLIKALVTRFARYGWADDLDEGLGLLRKGDLDVKLTLIDQLRISGLRGDHFPAIVSSVLDLLRDYRQSIDKSSLDTAFALAIRAIASCQGVTNTQAQLLLRVGNAFALRYLASGDERDLGLAGVYFQDAKRAFNKGDPMLSVVLLNLQHIGWMKLMECESRQKPVGFREMERFDKKAQAEDRGGLEPYMLGTALLKKGGRLHLDNAIFQFRRSLSLRPPQHPRRHDTLGNCAIALLKRFILTSNFEDLEESVQMQLQALALRPPNHPDRSRSLDNLANALCTRFNHRGDFRDLEECIARHREALSLQPPGHPDRPASLVGLASALDTRFEHKGNVVDLEESIASHRGALVLLPPGHPERSSSLINFAGCLLTRFKLQGDFRDLEECIACNEEALALMAPGDPERCGPLENVAISLSTRYQYEGNFLDLEESLSLFREVLNLRPPGHSDRPRTLRNLASSLSMRFRHKGDFCDLDECIDAHRKALSHQLPGHPGRGISLSSLGGALSIRFQYRHDLCDLEESVASHSEALALIPPGHQDLSNLLNNLAISLSARFERKGDIHDLKMAIKYHREALTLRPPGCADRPSSLNNLANALAIRFQREGDLSDLEECIVHVRDALTEFSRIGPALALEHEPNLPVVYNPDSLKTLTNLVTFLKLKYKVHSDSSIQDEIFRLLRSGAQFHGSSPLARLDHAGLWSSTCREFCRWENALEAHKHGVDLLPHLASLDLTLEQRQNVLIHAKELSGDAVQCAIEQGELETAVVFLSTARSVFWSQTLQFRGSLDNLEALHPDLASELRSVTGQLEIATGQNLEPDSMSAKVPSRPYLLARKREEIIARIRATDGFHDFLLPPCFDTLKNAARGGPVVFLNASEFGCHALIMKGDGTLLPLSLLADMSLLVYLADAIPLLVRGQEIDVHVRCNIDNCFDGRDVRLKAVRRREDYRTADDDFRDVLEILWEVVAQPVITALGLSKTSAPQRIWWCPTGPFAFLPIHAAGIYASSPMDSDCLSDYAVSSYCSSPQDLLSPPPEPNPDFKMLVAIEPERLGPGVPSLPSTREELEKIELHIPEAHRLVTRVGSAGSPATSILEDINTASIVHFGCHGMQDTSNPLASCLLLSGGELTMSSLIRNCRPSTAALAYLSACETAMGDRQRPDESLTLAATMQFAGFRSVVATMWSIHDQDAPIVADAFYRHLFRHGKASPPDITDAAFGLHLAVKELRELGRPFHQWVPFVHHGI